MRNTIRRMMLGTALVAGLLGTGVANAAPQQYRGGGDRGGFRAPERGGFRGPERGVEHREFARGYERPVYRNDYRFRDGFRVGYPVAEAYIPPCPGDGYDWNAGYYDGGIWVPGAWRLRAGFYGSGYGYGAVAHVDRGRVFERGFDRDRNRGFERGNRERR
jgi:hypothetical protein